MRDLTIIWGLIFVFVGTLLVTPQLLTAEFLVALDERWLNSPLPAVQIAFARYARRGLKFALRAAARVAGASVLAAVTAFVALKLHLVHGGLAGWGFALWNAAIVVSLFAVVVLVVGYALSKAFGKPGTLPAEPITMSAIGERLDEEGASLPLLRGAVVLVLFGTVLQIVATIFLPAH